MLDIPKKMMVVNLIVSQLLLIVLAVILQFIFNKQLCFEEIFLLNFTTYTIFIGIFSSVLLLLIQLAFFKFISAERLFEQINAYLLQNFSLKELSLIFLVGAISEEFLFRATIQPKIGILLGSLIFTVVHFRYLRKILILIEVFIIGLVLGLSYYLTSSIWVPIFCHFLVNLTTAFLYKIGYLSLDNYS